MITTQQAIMSLRPAVEFVLTANDVEGIIWHTPNVEPLTTAQVEAEVLRLEQAAVNAEAERVAARESAVAKLSALGLNEVEINAMMGGM